MSAKPRELKAKRKGLKTLSMLAVGVSLAVAQPLAAQEQNPFMIPPPPENKAEEQESLVEEHRQDQEVRRFSSMIKKERLSMIGQINQTTVYFHEPTECRLYEKNGAFTSSVCLPVVAQWMRNNDSN